MEGFLCTLPVLAHKYIRLQGTYSTASDKAPFIIKLMTLMKVIHVLKQHGEQNIKDDYST